MYSLRPINTPYAWLRYGNQHTEYENTRLCCCSKNKFSRPYEIILPAQRRGSLRLSKGRWIHHEKILSYVITLETSTAGWTCCSGNEKITHYRCLTIKELITLKLTQCVKHFNLFGKSRTTRSMSCVFNAMTRM